jgi:hypothetical protein
VNKNGACQTPKQEMAKRSKAPENTADYGFLLCFLKNARRAEIVEASASDITRVLTSST